MTRYLVAGAVLGAVLAAVSDTAPVKRTVHVALGRPLGYRLHIKEGVLMVSLPNTRIDGCLIEGRGDSHGRHAKPEIDAAVWVRTA